MSEDPKLFDAGDYNLFRYCHNDPIDFTDPMGLAEQYHDLLVYAKVRGAVQEVLRQIAQQKAYAHAMTWSGHGIAGVAAANYGVSRLSGAVQGLSRMLGLTRGESRAPASLTREYDKLSGGPQTVIDHATGKATYWNHIRWKLTAFSDKSGQQPLGGNIPVHETINYDWNTAVDFAPGGTQTADYRTYPGGYVYDEWHVPFTSLQGRVDTRQSVLIGGLRASSNIRVWANGGYKFLDPSGNTASFGPSD